MTKKQKQIDDVTSQNVLLVIQVQELAIERNSLRDELESVRNSQTIHIEKSMVENEVIVEELKQELNEVRSIASSQ